MQVKSIAESLNKLPFVIKISVLSVFEWPLKTVTVTGFTVVHFTCISSILKIKTKSQATLAQ